MSCTSICGGGGSAAGTADVVVVSAALRYMAAAALDTGFCYLIGSITSDVIGWCYKTFQSSFGFENKRRSAMPLIYITERHYH